MRLLALYLAGVALAAGVLILGGHTLLQRLSERDEPAEPADFADLGAAPFTVTDRLVLASGPPAGLNNPNHNPGVLLLACTTGGEMALVLRVKLQVEEVYLRAGEKATGRIAVWARRADLLNNTGEGAEFRFPLTLANRGALDTVVSALMSPAGLEPLATSFGSTAPEQVSVSGWETGTHMAGAVTAQEISDFSARCR